MKTKLPFLESGGEMGRLMRAMNWSATAVGDPQSWPQSLKTLISTMLRARFPMFLWWGSELTCFYNDAYRPSLGENGKHPAILGAPAEKAWSEIWPVIKPLIDKVLSGESTWSEDQLIPIERNGKLEDVYWTFSYSPVFDDLGASAGVLVICQETTEAVNSLRELKERESQLLFTIQAAELGTWDLNPFTNRFIGNDQLKEWFGLGSGDEIDLSEALSSIADKDRDRVVAAIQEALRSGSNGNYDIEYSIIPPKIKKEIKVLARGRAVFNEENIAYRFSGTLQDLTRLKLADSKLRENEERLNLVIDTSELGIWELELGTDDIVCSGRYFQIFGFQKDQKVSHRKLLDMLYPDDEGIRDKAFEKAMEKGDLYYQSRILWDDQTVHWIEVYGRMVRDETGKPLKLIGTVRDITDQKKFSDKLEKQVRERTRELEYKNEELRKMNVELESFAYVSSHDLQEPLRKIQIFSSMLTEEESGSFTDSGKDYLHRIQNAAGRMHVLIEDLLTYSRASDKDVVYEQTDLSIIVADVIAHYKDLIQEKNAILELGPFCTIQAIRYQIRQLFMNLVGNAIKFSSENLRPAIKIEAVLLDPSENNMDIFQNPAADCRIIVADNGIGFDPVYKEKIFDVFQRLHGRGEYAGTGIGLSIVKKIVENHRGTITASSRPDEGARFEIHLPTIVI